MRQYLKQDEWCIIEEGFNPEHHQASESIFSIGNGHMGQRANFEERYSGPSLQGSYIAGIYYPDKTRVGWWKNGYPEYFAKVLNSPNWIGIDVQIEDHILDLYTCKTEDFIRKLNMQEGTLSRSFIAIFPDGKRIKVETLRFLSMSNNEVGAINYSITPLNFSGNITFSPYLDGDVRNEDSNYDETFWTISEVYAIDHEAYLITDTKKLNFRCAFGMTYQLFLNGDKITTKSDVINTTSKVGNKITQYIEQDQTFTIVKYGCVINSTNYQSNDMPSIIRTLTRDANKINFNELLTEHKTIWKNKWITSDIQIKGDLAAQQGIRFNIFQLNQTYTGEDERLNVGPKGFTGEKYGGTTYWDTEAYCIPFFLATAPSEVTRNLLVYRFKHLQKAIENAQKLGFKNGAALYPMVTINGEECHNEWEITFEEIHRNGAIAFAIHNYIRHTGDYKYLEDYGLKVLIGIARFWAQRATFSQHKNKYVILGVTGPNEYENNVNNNWYTNKLAQWCLNYAIDSVDHVKNINSSRYNNIVKDVDLNPEQELHQWQTIADNMHFPYDKNRQISLQQDGFLDKELITAEEIPTEERPINQHWSWDRILRSCFIKQADTLQGYYLFEEEFSMEEIKRHFNFYEPRTVHESSLSPCVHSILAAKIGNIPKAYQLYLRTSRLDLDDYNNEVHEGLHITSMAGTWMSIVEGFGGKRVHHQKLYLSPSIPSEWEAYSFRIKFMNNDMEIKVDQQKIEIISHAFNPIHLFVYNISLTIPPQQSTTIALKTTR